MPEPTTQIGTLREKPLHSSLKAWCARPGDMIECPVGNFVIDLVRDELLIEVQTRGFSSLKTKAAALLSDGHRLRIVHPIPVDKWIVKIADHGEVVSRRRSPKHGQILDVFGELVSIADLLVHPLLEVEVVLIVEEEHRRHDPTRAWRRRGWVVVERRLVEVVGTRLISEPADLAELLPDDLPIPFTTGDLAASLGCSIRIARQMAYCLRTIGVLAVTGKTGNSIEYRLA